MNKKEKLALFLGMLAGDGCLPIKHSGEGYRDYAVQFYNADKNIVKLFSELFLELFNSIGKIRYSDRKNKQRLFEFCKYSKEIVNKIKKLGFPEGVKRDILRVPKYIKKSSKLEKASFVLGVLITDGCIRKRGDILFHSGSKLFLKDLSNLIENLIKVKKKVAEYTQREKFKSYQLNLNIPEAVKLISSMPTWDNGTPIALRAIFPYGISQFDSGRRREYSLGKRVLIILKMKINREEVADKFQDLIEMDRSYQKVQKIVLDNVVVGGDVWIIGSYLYKNLIKLANRTNNHAIPEDYDFLVEKPKSKIKLPFGWWCKRNIFGNLKFIPLCKLMKIDFVPLDKLFITTHKGVEPSISSYIHQVPLNIQSIAYNLRTGVIEGKGGLESIEDRLVLVNNSEMLEEAVKKRKGMTHEKYIESVADSLGFEYKL
jgi:hypothetical protein